MDDLRAFRIIKSEVTKQHAAWGYLGDYGTISLILRNVSPFTVVLDAISYEEHNAYHSSSSGYMPSSCTGNVKVGKSAHPDEEVKVDLKEWYVPYQDDPSPKGQAFFFLGYLTGIDSFAVGVRQEHERSADFHDIPGEMGWRGLFGPKLKMRKNFDP